VDVKCEVRILDAQPECPSLKLLWIDRLLKVGTGVSCELFVALGFVSLPHLVKRCADEGTSRMEYH
jgi:hypothetical protein